MYRTGITAITSVIIRMIFAIRIMIINQMKILMMLSHEKISTSFQSTFVIILCALDGKVVGKLSIKE